MNAAIFSSACASALIFSASQSTGTVIRLRSFPLIWMTIVISSSLATAGSKSGQGMSAAGLSLPSLSQSSSVMCGTIGVSSRIAVSRASRTTDRAVRLSLVGCLTLYKTLTSSMTALMAVLKWKRSSISCETLRIV